MRAKVVVDASGQSSMITNRLKLREWDPDAEEGGPLDVLGRGLSRHRPGRGRHARHADAGQEGLVLVHPAARRHRQRRRRAPTSITCSRARRQGPRGDLLRGSRALPGRQASASPTADACDGFRATKEYSYRSTQAAGDGWVLVGDAFGFLDPLYSSGVLLALKSGQLAADAVVEGLAKSDTSAAAARQMGAADFRRAWTACGGWSASITTASASAASSSSIPHLRAI